MLVKAFQISLAVVTLLIALIHATTMTADPVAAKAQVLAAFDQCLATMGLPSWAVGLFGNSQLMSIVYDVMLWATAEAEKAAAAIEAAASTSSQQVGTIEAATQEPTGQAATA